MPKVEMLVVKSKVREYAKKKKVNLGGDAAEALSREVMRLVDRAVERAKANRRSTVKGRDI
ncbi:MAG TPA: hypothetical protein HA230_00590 [Candidatus Aenigmarchaeota archaeon]|nr:hypothetical protein [Candidatus Aenigmarchaeota archaeon]